MIHKENLFLKEIGLVFCCEMKHKGVKRIVQEMRELKQHGLKQGFGN
jgi:hypothetical protein